MQLIKGKYAEARVMTDVLEPTTLNQINEMLNFPGVNGKVVVMPDCHVGKGSVIGFTMPYTSRIIPNIVGVDIGCGMFTIFLHSKPNLSLKEINRRIRSVIPIGMGKVRKNSPYHLMEEYQELFKRVEISPEYARLSIGSLGSGNHFIEYGEHDGMYFITIHTGSRNLGVKVANYHQKIADAPGDLSGDIARARAQKDRGEITGKELRRWIEILRFVNKPLEYLEKGGTAELYLHDMNLAQKYAEFNRYVIAQEICNVLELTYTDSISSVHNFIDMEDMIIRKGAIRSYIDEQLIIPINRTFGTVIGKGKSNPDWNFSAPHGAGRLMSRRAAKDLFTQDRVTKYMEDHSVFSTNDPIDEHDLAYKSPEQILPLIEESVEVLFIITPLLNIK